MKTYAMYKGYKDTKIPKNRIYIVGYYEAPHSYIIRCKGMEFVYSSIRTLMINWQFFAPTDYPVVIEDREQ